ncbi:RusA family crossover junction endodeoxyribonuclease [Nitrospira sp. NS4]|uniref:RusA family crossover junction endodeoxyribonuclease n=1 Tax=Nitrospira sp. NS4 TaxID=3414498 RepID=UPI003C2ADD0F
MAPIHRPYGRPLRTKHGEDSEPSLNSSMPAGRHRTGPRPSKVPIRTTSYRRPEAPNSTNGIPSSHSAHPPVRPKPPQAPLHIPATASTITAEQLCITLPVPPSINHQYATVNGRRILSSSGRAFKLHVGQQLWLALSQSAHKQALLHRFRTEPLALSIRFYFTSPLRRDVDGGLKIAQDALCEGIGLNDNRIIETHLYKDLDRTNPRIEVSLSLAAHSPPKD